MKSNKVQKAINDYVINQIKGYINIELGKIACQYGLDIGYRTDGGIDVYVNDPKYCDQESIDPIIFLPEFNDCDEQGYDLQDKLMIAHYHEDDLLWLINNIKDECFKMGLDIRKYARINNLSLVKKG